MKPGALLRYEVTHVGKTKTRIKGDEEVSNFHTGSIRHFAVAAVDDNNGESVFDHVIERVEMTQQAGDKDEIRWNSDTDTDPPAMFAKVAEKIGQKLSTIRINARGQQLDREDFGGSKANLGMGELTLAFPDEPIAVGGHWSIPREIKARTGEGEVQTIKIREVYTLEKVQTGVASISVRSEPLTPMREESIRAQVVQQLSNGKIRFDVDNGHMISKELDWDETVVGFQGPNSMMEYRARMTERLIDEATAIASSKSATKK